MQQNWLGEKQGTFNVGWSLCKCTSHTEFKGITYQRNENCIHYLASGHSNTMYGCFFPLKNNNNNRRKADLQIGLSSVKKKKNTMKIGHFMFKCKRILTFDKVNIPFTEKSRLDSLKRNKVIRDRFHGLLFLYYASSGAIITIMIKYWDRCIPWYVKSSGMVTVGLEVTGIASLLHPSNPAIGWGGGWGAGWGGRLTLRLTFKGPRLAP